MQKITNYTQDIKVEDNRLIFDYINCNSEAFRCRWKFTLIKNALYIRFPIVDSFEFFCSMNSTCYQSGVLEDANYYYLAPEEFLGIYFEYLYFYTAIKFNITLEEGRKNFRAAIDMEAIRKNLLQKREEEKQKQLKTKEDAKTPSLFEIN